MIEKEILLACIIAVCILICILALVYFRKKIISSAASLLNSPEQEDIFKTRIEEMKKQITEEYQLQMEKSKATLRQYFMEDALRRSKNLTKGKVAVHLAPFSVNGRLNPSEIVYLGGPIDMISFTNIEKGEDLSIDFIEIKTGNSALNKKQRLIKKAINDCRIYYRTVNI
jgi:predicted Holliday junction resolvase-like endonuclease